MFLEKQNFYEESRRLIRKAMMEHNLVLFVGAGTSLDAGMPSWGDAVSQIASCLKIAVSSADMLKIPQYYYNSRGKKDYTELMRKIFKYKVPLQTQSIHDKILEFDTDIIITTNYDHLLEQAAEEQGKVFQLISADNDLPYKHGKELIKMHGDFEHDNFVLKEDDYLNYDRNFKLIKNYITSLAGTKTLLFIGYSFSDPDIKQIFSWLKDALGDDLQRAYMINLDSYSELEETYFKNFGINVIYANFISEEDKIPKTELLKTTLQWLLKDNDKSLVDELYQKIGGYQYLEMPYTTDVLLTLHSIGLMTWRISTGINDYEVSNYKDTRDTIKSDYLKHDINPEDKSSFFLLLCYVADQLVASYEDKRKVQEQPWYQAIKKNDYISIDEYNKIKTILQILGMSHCKRLQLKLQDNTYTIPLFSFTEYPADEFDTFDFKKLKETENKNDQWLPEADADLYLRLAHNCYFMHNYLKAYNLVKRAASRYYRHANYAKYFISKYNQYYIGYAITKFDQINSVTEEQKIKIKREYEKINLDRLFESLPELPEGYYSNRNKNKFLKDLYSFNLTYEMLQNVIKESEQLEKRKNTYYSRYFGAQILLEDIQFFYQYQQKNHFLVDDFLEVKSIYRIAIFALFSSIMIKDEKIKRKLQTFEILLAVRFLANDEMKMMLQGNSNIKVSDDGVQYLKTIIKNLAYEPDDIQGVKKYLYNVIVLCGHIQLTADLVKSIFEVLKQKLEYLKQIKIYHEEIRRLLENIKENIKDFPDEEFKLQTVKSVNTLLPVFIQCKAK